MAELISPAGLEAFIVKPENLEALEDNIGFRGDQFLQLKKTESAFDLKTKIPSARLTGLFHEVQRHTAQTLNIKDFGKVWFSEFDLKWFAKVGLKRGGVIGAGAQLVSVFDGIQPSDLW